MRNPELVGTVRDVRGDTVTATLTAEAVPGLTFSKGHAYQVGQVGAFVRIPLGLVDLFAVVVEVGAGASQPRPDDEARVAWAAPGEVWMRLELLGEGDRGATVVRGVSRYPAIGDPVHLVTADDLGRLYGQGPHARENHVRIGHMANGPHIGAYLDVNSLVSRHGAVVGSTGTGKSTTVAVVVRSLGDTARFPGSRIVVIDVHGEYAGVLGDTGQLYRVDGDSGGGRGYEPLLLPYWALTSEEVLQLAFGSLDEVSATAVRDWILRAKRAYVARHTDLGVDPAAVTADTPIPFSIRQMWFDFHETVNATHYAQQNAQTDATRAYERDNSGEELRGDAARVIAPTYKALVAAGSDRVFLSASPLNMRRQLERLASRLRDPRYAFLFDPGPWSPSLDGESERDLDAFLETWLAMRDGATVADLSNVPSSVLADVVGVLLRILYDALIWGRALPTGGRSRPLLVVLEEAHRYLGSEASAAATVVERIVKEGRKYGVGILLVSQRPSEIEPTILSQVGSFVVHRLSNQADRGIVRATLPDTLGALFDAVPVLRKGEAVVVGEAVGLPSRVVVEMEESRRLLSADPIVIQAGERLGWCATPTSEDYRQLAETWRLAGQERRG